LSPEPGGSTLPSAVDRAAASTVAQPASFDAALTELQHVVEELEAGSSDLERAVELLERGTSLARACERALDDAQLRVTRLTAESASPLADASADR
jgi:exodeoxyribonuclease VII small subunit